MFGEEYLEKKEGLFLKTPPFFYSTDMAEPTQLKSRYFYAALVIVGFIVYYHALYAPFAFDDTLYIVRNPWIRSPGNLLDTTPLRYIGDVSFFLNYRFFGPGPFSFHLVNVVVHIINAALVFSLIKLIFTTPFFVNATSRDASIKEACLPIALITSLVFLVHPINTQAVTYISQRYTSLSVLFYLAAVTLYLRARLGESAPGRSRGSIFLSAPYLGAFVATVLAMKTKEIAFTIPVVMALLEITLFTGRARKRLFLLLPFFLTLLIIPLSLLRPDALQSGGVNKAEEFMRRKKIEDLQVSSYQYLITQFTVIPVYIRMVFAPVKQHFNYYWPLRDSLLDLQVVTGGFFVISLLALSLYGLIRSVKRNMAYLFLISLGVVWFFVTSSVESSIIPIRDVINEHRVYLPGIGIILSAVSALFYLRKVLIKRSSMKLPAAVFTLVVAVVTAAPLGAAAFMRNGVWGDEVRLYEVDIQNNPNEADLRLLLGIAYFKRGRHEDAATEFENVVERKPGFFPGRNNLGYTYAALGRYAEAVEQLKVAARLRPDRVSPHFNLGVLYFKMGRPREAEAELRETLKLNPAHEKAAGVLSYILNGPGERPGKGVKDVP
ncbi:MAG: tetratricopeptide repeat protein [Thermodesulfobacteriota bacterium]|nr:MAG: tetratricopeptide repeat protein [Thermodesulfobacteriota bacterium]